LKLKDQNDVTVQSCIQINDVLKITFLCTWRSCVMYYH